MEVRIAGNGTGSSSKSEEVILIAVHRIASLHNLSSNSETCVEIRDLGEGREELELKCERVCIKWKETIW